MSFFLFHSHILLEKLGFEQLLTISVELGGKCEPVLWSLMMGKTTQDYLNILNFVKEFILKKIGANVSTIRFAVSSDCEEAMCSAIDQIYASAIHLNCSFHISQLVEKHFGDHNRENLKLSLSQIHWLDEYRTKNETEKATMMLAQHYTAEQVTQLQKVLDCRKLVIHLIKLLTSASKTSDLQSITTHVRNNQTAEQYVVPFGAITPPIMDLANIPENLDRNNPDINQVRKVLFVVVQIINDVKNAITIYMNWNENDSNNSIFHYLKKDLIGSAIIAKIDAGNTLQITMEEFKSCRARKWIPILACYPPYLDRTNNRLERLHRFIHGIESEIYHDNIANPPASAYVQGLQTLEYIFRTRNSVANESVDTEIADYSQRILNHYSENVIVGREQVGRVFSRVYNQAIERIAAARTQQEVNARTAELLVASQNTAAANLLAQQHNNENQQLRAQITMLENRLHQYEDEDQREGPNNPNVESSEHDRRRRRLGN